MKNKNPLLVPELREMLTAGNAKALQDFCEAGHPAVVADLISALSEEEAWAVLRHADLPLRAEIFSHLEDDLMVEMIGTLRRDEIARLLTGMPHDERADLFKRLPEERRQAVMPALAQAEREDLRRLTAYREGTAGAAMTSDYATLSQQLTVSQAIERLREVAPDKETIYYAYVVDENRKLLGFVSLKDLIVARRESRIADIMHCDVIFARVEDDQEDVARKIQKYDLIALPVLNGSDALVGIVTHDDAIDIIIQEHTEDMEKFMAIAGRHEDAVYMKTPAWVHFKNRSPWVIALAILGLVSGFIVQSFEGLLLQFAILAAFMPMLADACRYGREHRQPIRHAGGSCTCPQGDLTTRPISNPCQRVSGIHSACAAARDYRLWSGHFVRRWICCAGTVFIERNRFRNRDCLGVTGGHLHTDRCIVTPGGCSG